MTSDVDPTLKSDHRNNEPVKQVCTKMTDLSASRTTRIFASCSQFTAANGVNITNYNYLMVRDVK